MSQSLSQVPIRLLQILPDSDSSVILICCIDLFSADFGHTFRTVNKDTRFNTVEIANMKVVAESVDGLSTYRKS